MPVPGDAQRAKEAELRRVLEAFTPGEARKAKARAFWAGRQERRRRSRRAPALGGGEDHCPITLVALAELQEACVASDGYVYERGALRAWAVRNPTSPMTRAPLDCCVSLAAAKRGLRSAAAAGVKGERLL